jgi:cold shock CspA family protein
MSNQNDGSSNMGDLFQQRRAAAAARQRGGKDENGAAEAAPERQTSSKSFMEIQAEQVKEKNHLQRQERPANNSQFDPRRKESNHPSAGNSNRSSQQRGDRGGDRGDRGGDRRRGGGGSISRSNLPIEQGVVCALRESFGFIHCADRPEEIFFHYSEVTGCSPNELKMDDEVEFRVGISSNSRSDEKKMAAYQVRMLETGTIVWETEDQPGVRFQGLIERQIRTDQRSGRDSNNNNNASEGTIRVMVADDENAKADSTSEEEEKKKKSTEGPLVRYLASSYTLPGAGSKGDVRSSRQGPDRLGRGDLVEFSIVTDRRTKEKYARSITLVQSERERSRIEKEKKMLENATEEKGVVVSLKNEYGFIKSNKRRENVYFQYSHLVLPETEEEFVLKEGQELKFLVIVEGEGQKQKCSARQLECLPKGSVVFHTVIAVGVTGVVKTCPLPPGNTGLSDEIDGTVRLVLPIVDKEEDGTERTIEEVNLHFSDAPGGVFSYQQRGGPVGWMKEGDTLLFDVVKELSDGSYRVAPSKCTVPVGNGETELSSEASEESSGVRLLDLSGVGRAEGVIYSLKDPGGFGFIHFAERAVDIHFKFHDMLPNELQLDLRKYAGYKDDVSNQFKLEVGLSVSFDISAHGIISSDTRGRQGRGGHQQERENLKAQRVLLLPRSAVSPEKVIAAGVKGVVKSEDYKQAYAGFVDLDDEIEPMSLDERHPLVAKMIDSFLEESSSPAGRKSLVFRDVLSVKEDDVVVEMIQAKGNGLLNCTHIPVAGLSSHPGRLCIRRVEQEKVTKEDKEEGTTPKKQASKMSKTFRFDRSCLVEDSKEDVPPGAGDVVTFDLVQSRRTGKIMLQNLKVVERKEREEIVAGSSAGVGIVKEVVPSRNFGFISVMDETATKLEVLFFNLSKVVSDSSGNETPTSKKQVQIRKGDEVKFEIGVEKNGKRIALMVQVVPKGTIPAKAAKNACRGFILLEPSHTNLADTPARKSKSRSPTRLDTGRSLSPSRTSDKSPGRWSNVKDVSQKAQHKEIAENGRILLLEDGSGMFNKRKIVRKTDSAPDTLATVPNEDASAIDEGEKNAKCTDAGSGETTSEDHSICSHLPYMNGAIAIHGAGASSSMDGSSNPRRGDLVSFVTARNGKGVRDIRVVTRQAAIFVRGRLENIIVLNKDGEKGNMGTAKFIAATEKGEEYEIDLTEVVSCDATLLKDKQAVEGVLHDGKMYGICRTTDLYLESKLGASSKERQKLNITVKKDRGGKIMAQSMMATVRFLVRSTGLQIPPLCAILTFLVMFQGPDGTKGFAAGWTKRVSSRHASSVGQEEDVDETADSTNVDQQVNLDEIP